MTSPPLPGVGVFGTDIFTHAFVPLLRKEGFPILAIWGRTKDDALTAASALQIPFATHRIDDVLLRKDVDLIVILSSPLHHSQIAVKALGIGKHVLIHPPAALGYNETLRMVQAAQYYPSLFSVINFSLRFAPAVMRLKQCLCSGYVGSQGPTFIDVRLHTKSLVDSYSWVCDEHMGGGVLNIFGCHIVDLLHFITGGLHPVLRVHGVVRTLLPHTNTVSGIRHISSDDMSSLQLEMAGGLLANVNLMSHMARFQQEIVVSGSEGQLILKNGHLSGRKFHLDPAEEEVLHSGDEEDARSADDDDDDDKMHAHLPSVYLQATMHSFRYLAQQLQCAGRQESRDTDLASFEDALYVDAVIEAIRRSSAHKKWVKVKLDSLELGLEA